MLPQISILKLSAILPLDMIILKAITVFYLPVARIGFKTNKLYVKT